MMLDKPKYIFDSEGDGLLDTVKTIWCLVFKDKQTGVASVFLEDGREHFIKQIEETPEGSFIIGHNILGYDLPALKKVWDIDYTCGFLSDTWMGKKVFFVDTLHLSQFLNVERDGHSLEDWGRRLGFQKGDHSDFTKFSPEMLKYCHRDVDLTELVYDNLMNESKEKYK